ncbi:MAG: hypothetical protein AAF791_07805 [Bacteroidota bacterium]
MSGPLWHNAEYERVARALSDRPCVRSVSPSGSFANETHDALSDLDLTVVGLAPSNAHAVLGLFDAADVLGREEYVGADRALYRVLLTSGRQYDVQVLRTEQDADTDAPKVPLGGTAEFWFALHAAHHALARSREVVALDLVLASCRAITQAYWDAPATAHVEIEAGLRALDVRLDSVALGEAVAHVGAMAGLAFADADHSAAFARIIAKRSGDLAGMSGTTLTGTLGTAVRGSHEGVIPSERQRAEGSSRSRLRCRVQRANILTVDPSASVAGRPPLGMTSRGVTPNE